MGTILEWSRGGAIIPLIALVALVTAAVLVERGYAILVRGGANGRTFMERVLQLVRAGKVDDALKECAASRSALPDIGLLILRSRTRDEDALQNVADAAALAVIPRFRRRLDYLPLLIRVALSLGALGFLYGLYVAFSHAGASTAFDARRFSQETASALRPLIAAFVVAVPTMAAHAFLKHQADTIVENIEEFSARLVNALIDRPDVRLGHR
jgi:biopolymer transport protein ExbB